MHKNRVRWRARGAHVFATSATRASSARKVPSGKSQQTGAKEIPFRGSLELPVCVRSQRTANASYLHQSESDATRAREYGYSAPRARRSELRVRPRPFKIVAAGFCFSLFSRFSWFDAQFDWSGSTSKCDRSASQPFRGTPTQESTVCGAKRRLIFFTCEKNLRFRQLELGAGAGGSAGWSSAVEPTSCKPAGAQFQGSNNNASGTVGRDGCGNRLG